MKKCLIVLLFFLPVAALAQVRMAVRAGMNSSSIRFYDYDPEKRNLHRVNVGTMIEIPFDENWVIYTGPYYAGKGVQFGRTSSTNKVDSFTVRLNYFELPVTIGYKFNSANENRLAIVAGLYLSYGFGGESRIITYSRPPTTQLHKKETDQYKRLDAGFNLAALYEINNRYGIRIDYSKGLSNIERVGKQKNRVFGFSLFWYLKSKKEVE